MTLMQARWRLQLLAELGVGALQRKGQRAEDEKYTHLKEVTGRGAR